MQRCVFRSFDRKKLRMKIEALLIYFILLTALSDIHGNFILNGNFVVSMSKREINIHGAIFEYSGSNNTVERINSTDRIEEELTLQVNIYLFS